MQSENCKILAIFIVLLGSLFLAEGCVSTKATYLDPTAERYMRVPADSVHVFVEESELDTLEYIRVAYIEASGSGEWTSQTGMIDAIRKKAGELGCNGVLLPSIKEPGAGAKVAGAIFGTGTERKGNAIALRILGKKSTVPHQDSSHQ